MGITGLLPFLEKSSKKTNIKEFSGGTVAIDSYCWLHKGAFSCADKLMMGETTDAYVVYCMKYINMLLKYKIKPILVFDGQRLPAKQQTEIKRRKAREMNRHKAIELIRMGQVTEGTNLLKRAIDITHELALELIKQCQNENIDCIIAPYEADAQLAYLNISGIADVVITEDSDLTLFGCKKIFFKMDLVGNGVLIAQDQLHLAMDVRPEQFEMDKFRHLCILSGCDYLPSLPGIGLGKARKFITKNTDRNIHKALTRLSSVLNMKSLVVPQEYRDAFILADITFKHQLVFCPLQRKQVRLNPPPADITEDQLQYAGKELDADLALQLALGNCDPATLKMVHDFNPFKIERKRKRGLEQTIHTSIWSGKYKSKTKCQNSSPLSKNILNSSIINGKEFDKERKSLKNAYVSLNSHNNSNIQSSPEDDLHNTAILDMYNSSRDAKLTDSTNKISENYLNLTSSTSPDLLKPRNPFIKRVSDLTTSPTISSNENYRKRGRNLMRTRRTIIDENTVVESKYFSKPDKECNVLESENKDIDVSWINTNYNTILDTNVHDITGKQFETRFSITDIVQNANSMENTDNAHLLNQNDCLTNIYSNVPEKSNLYDRIDDVSLITHTMTDSCITNNFLISSSSNMNISDTTNYENANSSLNNSCEWINTKINPSFPHKKHILKKQSSSNLVRVNSITKRKGSRQSKQSPTIPRQQSLLDKYGFQKRYKAGQLRHSCCVVLLISHTTPVKPGCRVVIIGLL
ncbi:PREDICTED: exonuclease 1 [Cyphomyrmex costatus]|uniref:Exonuclease 1 n=1 Tax=Cyphomyrmex costatus TaxID=456900 RepID=A0A151IEK2_9HYME|nr:PREDICTED: exonuclease 1 [Cyphomyrmex costatus]KYM99279.1 Exonuclease 1 [Cyphomyrmex costatus]